MAMRPTLLPIALLLVLVALPAGLAGQAEPLTGNWTFTLNSPEGTATIPLTLSQEGEAITAAVRMPGADGGEPQVLFSGSTTPNGLRFFWELDYNGMQLDVTLVGEPSAAGYAGTADFSGLAQGDWTLARTE